MTASLSLEGAFGPLPGCLSPGGRPQGLEPAAGSCGNADREIEQGAGCPQHGGGSEVSKELHSRMMRQAGSLYKSSGLQGAHGNPSTLRYPRQVWRDSVLGLFAYLPSAWSIAFCASGMMRS
jgi:hypothetical protein